MESPPSPPQKGNRSQEDRNHLVSILLPPRRGRRPQTAKSPVRTGTLRKPNNEKAKSPLAFASGLTGAADEARTRYLHLGKVALYQMSYSRIFFRFILGFPPQNMIYYTRAFPPCQHFSFFFRIFFRERENRRFSRRFSPLFPLQQPDQCTQTSSCSPRRGRSSSIRMPSFAGTPPYSTAYIASVIGIDTPCCLARW